MNANKAFIGAVMGCYLITRSLFAGAFIFQQPVSLEAGDSPRAITSGDLFGNGTKELVVGDFGSSTLIGQSTPASLLIPENFALQVFAPSAGGLKPTAVIPTGFSPRGVCVFNLTGKSQADILVTNYDANMLQVFEWNGSAFVQIDQAPTLNMPLGVAAGFTRVGGTAFVAVADFGSNSISIFPIKNGKLGARTDIPVDANPGQVAVGVLGANYNSIVTSCLGTSKLDVLSVSSDDPTAYSKNQTIILPNSGTAGDFKLADLNQDGKTDIAVADIANNALLILLQQAGGSFLAQPALTTSGSHPNGLTVADLNGDGIPEITVANRDSDSLDIFQVVGQSYQLIKTLLVANDPITTYGPVEVAAFDTTGQGRMDLVATHMRSNTIRVLAQTGSASSQTVNSQELIPNSETSTATPSYFAAQVTLAPVPVKSGEPLCLFAPENVASGRLQVFNLLGEKVGDVSFNGSNPCWSTQGVAPGVYLVDVNLTYVDGSTAYTRKKILIAR